jgi:glucosyl-dolichyl phosphate glucuronosyltransferase
MRASSRRLPPYRRSRDHDVVDPRGDDRHGDEIRAAGIHQGRAVTAFARPVSVIVATYNRAAMLDECLTHLLAQRFAPGDEVIVVDNGSSDDTPSVIGRHQRASPVAFAGLCESRPGKSHAVTRAVAAATGDILAFTDDDVNVGSGWLETLRTAFTDATVALAGGPVVPRWEQTVPSWLRAARDDYPRLGAPIALLDYGVERGDLGPRTLLGANLAVRRDVFASVGGFPVHLGKLRGTLLSGEDHELCRRVRSAGRRSVYLPDAVVHHWVPADRARASYFLEWFFWSGITHAIMDADARRAEGRRVAGVPLYLGRRLATASAGVLGNLLTGHRARALDHAVDIAFATGYVSQSWGLTGRRGRVEQENWRERLLSRS